MSINRCRSLLAQSRLKFRCDDASTRIAHTRDGVPLSLPRAALAPRRVASRPGTALDVAMGQGRNAVYLAQQGWRVTGFDVADEGAKIARAAAQRLGVTLEAVVASNEQFDWDQSDGTRSSWPMPHIEDRSSEP
jgi:2-polyprenyl-3-methyl-5-hydroxy-6-metoxy-1,4-benzoquinol methylase